ncbi:MAG: hypothetical protein ACLFP8_07345 [Alphaproteobacteria bacterium]
MGKSGEFYAIFQGGREFFLKGVFFVYPDPENMDTVETRLHFVCELRDYKYMSWAAQEHVAQFALEHIEDENKETPSYDFRFSKDETQVTAKLCFKDTAPRTILVGLLDNDAISESDYNRSLKVLVAVENASFNAALDELSSEDLDGFDPSSPS